MVATSVDIIHQQDFKAEKQCEVLVGADSIIRINIDGICVLRVRIEKGCELMIDARVVNDITHFYRFPDDEEEPSEISVKTI